MGGILYREGFIMTITIIMVVLIAIIIIIIVIIINSITIKPLEGTKGVPRIRGRKQQLV